jgi:Tfp pilus assembly protein PilX
MILHDTTNEPMDDQSESGSAILAAVMVMLVVSLLSLGLMSQTMLVSKIAGSERWSLKSFYAADSGLSLAQTRARVQALAGFNFTLRDIRGASGQSTAGVLNVAVDPLVAAGAPRLVIGSEANAGQGTDTPLVVQGYRTSSTGQHVPTASEREIDVVFGIGPMPATISD